MKMPTRTTTTRTTTTTKQSLEPVELRSRLKRAQANFERARAEHFDDLISSAFLLHARHDAKGRQI
jgi:hypothetical protein